MGIDFIVDIETKGLLIQQLHNNRFDRLEFIKELSDIGWSNRDICNYFNNNNILTPTGKKYSVNNIWGTLKKFRERLNRESDEGVIEFEEKITMITYNEPLFYDSGS